MKDWFNEYKFVERGGRYSLAEQTNMHAKYRRDFRAKTAGEQDDVSHPHDYRSGKGERNKGGGEGCGRRKQMREFMYIQMIFC